MYTAPRVYHFNFTNNYNVHFVLYIFIQAAKVEIEAIAIVGEIKDV